MRTVIQSYHNSVLLINTTWLEGNVTHEGKFCTTNIHVHSYKLTIYLCTSVYVLICQNK